MQCSEAHIEGHRLTCSVDVSAQYPVLIERHWQSDWLQILSTVLDTCRDRFGGGGTVRRLTLVVRSGGEWHRASVGRRAAFYADAAMFVGHSPNCTAHRVCARINSVEYSTTQKSVCDSVRCQWWLVPNNKGKGGSARNSKLHYIRTHTHAHTSSSFSN